MYTFIQHARQPVYAEMIRPRSLSLSIAGFGAAQLGVSALGINVPCPFHATFGIPCPGCGLTRSLLAIFHGDLHRALLLHPFGPVLLAALIAALIAGLMPQRPRQLLIHAVGFIEQKTALTSLGLLLLLLLWAVRVTGLSPLDPV